MTAIELRPREAILGALLAGEAGTAELARRLDMPERSTRRRLRLLVEEGYVFTPERGRYRITSFGRRAIEAPEAGPEPAARGNDPATAGITYRRLWGRNRGQQS